MSWFFNGIGRHLADWMFGGFLHRRSDTFWHWLGNVYRYWFSKINFATWDNIVLLDDLVSTEEWNVIERDHKHATTCISVKVIFLLLMKQLTVLFCCLMNILLNQLKYFWKTTPKKGLVYNNQDIRVLCWLLMWFYFKWKKIKLTNNMICCDILHVWIARGQKTFTQFFVCVLTSALAVRYLAL